MRIPRTPPSWIDRIASASPPLRSLLFQQGDGCFENRYRHWDKLRHLPLPDKFANAGGTHEDWWASLKLTRSTSYRRIPLIDSHAKPFQFALPDAVLEHLHHLDQKAGGMVATPITNINKDMRDQYVMRSLAEEAITSSQLEGAVTTREVAKQMLRSGRPPRDTSERMILNNFHTMEQIRTLRGRPLSIELLFSLHRTLTEGTLEKRDAVGRFRTSEEHVVVADNFDEVMHAPPDAALLPQRIEQMCAFANDTGERRPGQSFVHPILRSIILHFWLAYDHPFVDGNGRCARALFYWSMMNSGYWLAEFISISHVVRQAPVRYGRAFLYTETDDNDLTYFILYHLAVLAQAFEELHKYMDRKSRELHQTELLLHRSDQFNHRQLALLAHALRHPDTHYTIAGHRHDHQVAYQTARTDLLDLGSKGLLNKRLRGKEQFFFPAPSLPALLATRSLKTEL